MLRICNLFYHVAHWAQPCLFTFWKRECVDWSRFCERCCSIYRHRLDTLTDVYFYSARLFTFPDNQLIHYCLEVLICPFFSRDITCSNICHAPIHSFHVPFSLNCVLRFESRISWSEGTPHVTFSPNPVMQILKRIRNPNCIKPILTLSQTVTKAAGKPNHNHSTVIIETPLQRLYVNCKTWL